MNRNFRSIPQPLCTQNSTNTMSIFKNFRSLIRPFSNKSVAYSDTMLTKFIFECTGRLIKLGNRPQRHYNITRLLPRSSARGRLLSNRFRAAGKPLPARHLERWACGGAAYARLPTSGPWRASVFGRPSRFEKYEF